MYSSHPLKARSDVGSRQTHHYCAHRAVTGVQVQRDSLGLRAPIMFEPYFSSDGSARRMEGKVFAVCIRGDSRRRWWGRQGEVEDELPFQRRPPF